MLFGYVFNITIVSALINLFMTLRFAQDEQRILSIFIPLVAIAMIFIIMRTQKIRSFTDRQLER
jgi:Ca2+/Na+ antiporter